MQEGYHGSWQRARLPEKSEQFCLKMPIIVGDRLLGRLEIIGNAKSMPIVETLDQLNDRFAELHSQIIELLQTVEADSNGEKVPSLLVSDDSKVIEVMHEGESHGQTSSPRRERSQLSKIGGQPALS